MEHGHGGDGDSPESVNNGASTSAAASGEGEPVAAPQQAAGAGPPGRGRRGRGRAPGRGGPRVRGGRACGQRGGIRQAGGEQPPPGAVQVQVPLRLPAGDDVIASAVNEARGQLEFLEDVRGKLEEEKYKATPNPRPTKSKAWESFHVVVDATSNIEVGAVQCVKCSYLLKTQADGCTSTMTRHLRERCGGELGQRKRPLPSVKAKQQGKDAVGKACAEDMLSFEAVAGSEGMLDLLQSMVDIGSTYGRVDVRELLPEPCTISEHVKKEAKKIRAKIIPAIKKAMRDGACAATIDGWTDDFTKQKYICLTVHFVNSQWELETEYLVTIAVDDEEESGEYTITFCYIFSTLNIISSSL